MKYKKSRLFIVLPIWLLLLSCDSTPQTPNIVKLPTTVINQSSRMNNEFEQLNHYTKNNKLTFIGVYHNTSSNFIHMSLSLNLIDKNGDTLLNIRDTTLPDVLFKPDQRVGFRINVNQPPLNWVDALPQNTTVEASQDEIDTYKKQNSSIIFADGKIEPNSVIKMTMRNTSDSEIIPKKILVSGYDSEGKIVDVSIVDTNTKVIPANSSIDFTAKLDEANKIVHYEVTEQFK